MKPQIIEPLPNDLPRPRIVNCRARRCRGRQHHDAQQYDPSIRDIHAHVHPRATVIYLFLCLDRFLSPADSAPVAAEVAERAA
jgi:hypothetical protein